MKEERAPRSMAGATGKRLLALIRDADYAHPGEEEANRLLFAGLSREPGRRILDAGCGAGGTAAWVQAQGFGVVTGVEVDSATVLLARERHPEVTVVEDDLQSLARVPCAPFELIYSMTALYAVLDQHAALTRLAELASPGARLLLLEYADPHGSFAAAARGHASWEWWRPLAPEAARDVLAASGWDLGELRDLTPEFTRWYQALCRRIAARRSRITREFGVGWYEFVAAEYAGLLAMVRRGDLGGVLVRATARRRPAV